MEIIAKLRINRITQRKLAEQLGVTEEYVSMILNGKAKKSKDIEQRMNEAIKQICGMEES